MTRIATILTLVAALACAGAAGASTVVVSESDAKGGDFSNSHANPTVFGQDVMLVTGSQNRKSDTDWLLFDGFATGTERLEFTFTNVGGNWGGLSLRLKDEAFKNARDSWPLLGAWYLDGISDERPVTVSYVLDGYTGPIFARVDFYHGNDVANGTGVSYSIARIGDTYMPEAGVSPAAVPVPAAGLFLIAGLGALAALRQTRKSA